MHFIIFWSIVFKKKRFSYIIVFYDYIPFVNNRMTTGVYFNPIVVVKKAYEIKSIQSFYSILHKLCHCISFDYDH